MKKKNTRLAGADYKEQIVLFYGYEATELLFS
jgi:hypothetical protein